MVTFTMVKDLSKRAIPHFPSDSDERDIIRKLSFRETGEKAAILKHFGIVGDWKAREVELKLLESIGFKRIFPEKSENQQVKIDIIEKTGDNLLFKKASENISDANFSKRVVAFADSKKLSQFERKVLLAKCGVTTISEPIETIDTSDF